MKQEQITLDKVDINILKASAYDRFAQMEQIKNELDMINKEIARRATIKNENKTMEEETIVPVEETAPEAEVVAEESAEEVA